MCILNPGPAFTSRTAPPDSFKGLVKSWAIISIPQISRPIILEIRSAINILYGWIKSVTSSAVPPVLRLAVLLSLTNSPFGTIVSGVIPFSLSNSMVNELMEISVSTFSWPYPLRSSLFISSTNC